MTTKSKTALGTQLDETTVRQLLGRVDTNSDLIVKIASEIVQDYTQPLDEVMQMCQTITQSDIPPSDEELEDLVFLLPNTLYFTGEGQEVLGLREDIAKAVRTEKYNEVRETATGTVADKNAAAELEVQYETINQAIYQRAYRIIKNKMDAGFEQLNSIKKIMSRREREFELSKVNPHRYDVRRPIDETKR